MSGKGLILMLVLLGVVLYQAEAASSSGQGPPQIESEMYMLINSLLQ